jgi:5-methylcytosine-specific restriction protein A
VAWSKQSSTARGYGSRWQKLRLVILERDKYLCQCPDCLGGDKRLTPATEVDHITPKAHGGTDDEGNLRAVNTECHKRLTMLQKGYKPQPKIGSDGWPIAV